MGNTVKGTNDIRGGNINSVSAENETTNEQERSQINKPVTTETMQRSDLETSDSDNKQSPNNVKNKASMAIDKNTEMNNNKDTCIPNEDGIDSDDNSVLTGDQQSVKHKRKYIKTPFAEKSKLQSTDMISKSSQAKPHTKRSSSTKIGNKTTFKLKEKRSCSEPVTFKFPLKEESIKEELPSVHVDENMDTLMTASSELDNDDMASEFEIGSSLKSVSLDSSLFDSQLTIETHTSMEQQSSASQIYNENRQKLKRGLIDYYMSFDLDVPEFPLLPCSNKSTQYWSPWMSVTHKFNQDTDDTSELREHISDLDTFDLNNYKYDKTIHQLNHLFNHEGRDIKNIYIVGDSGTGKTAFCRNLVHRWCSQHKIYENFVGLNDPNKSHNEDLFSSTRPYMTDKQAKYIGSRKSRYFGEELSSVIDSNSSNRLHDMFSDTNVLDNYDFLFYIPLFFGTNHVTIYDIIDTQYRNILNGLRQDVNGGNTKSNVKTRVSFLNELFEKESEKCLIVLDGFDQWQQNKMKNVGKSSKSFLPKKDPDKNYTVIVTSTSTQLEAVGIEITQHDLEITLHGIAENASNDMINLLVHRLNKTVGLRKKPSDFIGELKSRKLIHFKRLPLVLQPILYLWYHAETIGDTECDIFSRILELQFKAFSDHLHVDRSVSHKNSAVKPGIPFNTVDNTVNLPRYYINLSSCQKFKELISLLGKISLTTRNQCLKIFDASTIEVYGFNQVEISCLLKVGVFTQNKVPGFSQLRHSKTVFFCDEKMQEFLASTYLVQLFQNTTYENIGRVNVHTCKILSVLESHFDIFNSFENVLQFSNVIPLICGLSPPTTEEITSKIHNVVSSDKRALEFRESLETESEDVICEDIQDLISNCARESLSVNPNKILLHIGDISFGNFEPNNVGYIVPSQVKSLMIDADKEYSVSTRVSAFIQETRIFNGLQKLIVKDEISKLSLEDINSLHLLNQNCLKTLKVLSYVLNYRNRIIYLKITQDLHELLLKMPNLIELELKGIKLSHIEFSTLSFTLSRLSGLRRLHLSDLTCEMQRCDCEEHKMDFLQYNKLEHIEIDGRQLPIIGISKEKLITCNLGNLPQGAEIQIFSSLRNAKCLKHFIQKVRLRPPFISQTLTKSLNSWHGLETLYLNGINFGENQFILNAKMSHLARVKLVETRMSKIVWCNFIDSLQELAQGISIVTRDIHVSPIEEDVTRDPLRRPVDAETRAVMLARETEREEAFNYVIEKANCFTVLFYMDSMFDFEKMRNAK